LRTGATRQKPALHIKLMKNKPELQTKFLKILTTGEQRETISRAIDIVMNEESVKEGRALELIASDFLSGYPYK